MRGGDVRAGIWALSPVPSRDVGRVAKCHTYCRYICVKLLKIWDKILECNIPASEVGWNFYGSGPFHWGNFTQETYTFNPNSGQELWKEQVNFIMNTQTRIFAFCRENIQGVPIQISLSKYPVWKVKIIVLETLVKAKICGTNHLFSWGEWREALSFILMY